MSRMYRHWFWHSKAMNWLERRIVKLNNYIWRKRWSGKFRNVRCFYKHPLFTETVLDTVLEFLFDVNPVTQITMTMIHQSLAKTSSRVISEEAQKFMAMSISEEEEEEGGGTVH